MQRILSLLHMQICWGMSAFLSFIPHKYSAALLQRSIMKTVHNTEGHHGYLLDVVRGSHNEAYVQILVSKRANEMLAGF